MLVKKGNRKCILLFICLSFSACKSDRKHDVKITEISLDFNLFRFEKDLFELKPQVTTLSIEKLRDSYGLFFDLYVKKVVSLNYSNDTLLAIELSKYISDKYITEVFQESQRLYDNAEWLKKDLSDAFKYYSVYFPGKPIPRIITFIAPFNYNVLAADSTLAIGLDMYLGSDYKYYPSAGFPLYKINKLRKEYIAADAVSAWLQSDYEIDISHNDLLNNMVQEGKIIYATSMLLPDLPDTLLFGFSATQLSWCKQNEENVWKFFIEQKLLFNKNPGEFVKFVNDGATTSGFPADAPARIGCYIGWQIVSSYMEKNTTIKLEQLMNNSDGNTILMKSGYKPKKNS